MKVLIEEVARSGEIHTDDNTPLYCRIRHGLFSVEPLIVQELAPGVRIWEDIDLAESEARESLVVVSRRVSTHEDTDELIVVLDVMGPEALADLNKEQGARFTEYVEWATDHQVWP